MIGLEPAEPVSQRQGPVLIMFCRCLKSKHYDLPIEDIQLFNSFIYSKCTPSAYTFSVLSTKDLSVKKFISVRTICSCPQGAHNPMEMIYDKEISKWSGSKSFVKSGDLISEIQFIRTSNHWQVMSSPLIQRWVEHFSCSRATADV